MKLIPPENESEIAESDNMRSRFGSYIAKAIKIALAALVLLVVTRMLFAVWVQRQIANDMAATVRLSGIDDEIGTWLTGTLSIVLACLLADIIFRSWRILFFNVRATGKVWLNAGLLLLLTGIFPFLHTFLRRTGVGEIVEVDGTKMRWFAPDGEPLIGGLKEASGVVRTYNRPGHRPSDNKMIVRVTPEMRELFDLYFAEKQQKEELEKRNTEAAVEAKRQLEEQKKHDAEAVKATEEKRIQDARIAKQKEDEVQAKIAEDNRLAAEAIARRAEEENAKAQAELRATILKNAAEQAEFEAAKQKAARALAEADRAKSEAEREKRAELAEQRRKSEQMKPVPPFRSQFVNEVPASAEMTYINGILTWIHNGNYYREAPSGRGYVTIPP